jgi:hypothetical protein
LPFGHYNLTLSARTGADLPPDTEVARLSIKNVGGGQVFNIAILAGDLSQTGQVSARFFNPTADHRRLPLVLHLTSTGAVSVWLQDVLISPQPFYALLLPYLLLAGLALLAGGHWLLTRHRPDVSHPTPRSGRWAWGVIIVVLAAVGSYVTFVQLRSGRVYSAIDLEHFVGRKITDAAAADGAAWLVDPAQDPPQKAVYGPFEFFDTGVYRVTFRLKLTEAVDAPQEVARLRVAATANFDELLTQPLRVEHFSRADLYHDMVLTVTNPRRQALSFEVDYLGVAPLAIDRVSIEKTDP